MKKLIKKTKIIWLLIVAMSFVGCEDDDDAVLPQVVASFAQTIDEDTGVVSFINLSENADSYSWDFGDNTTSTEVNPTKVFGTGTYTVVLTAENTAGASGTFEDEIVINIPLPVNFPINFDDPNVNYNVNAFNGVSFEIVDNPDPTGSNTSTAKVGAITNVGAAFEGFSFDLGMALDLTTLKSAKINFWSDTPIDVLMKLEQGTGGDVETTASHGGTGWEMIAFNFSSDASYSRITFFVDGPGTTAGTFYIDDIEQIETPAPTSGCNDVPVAATALPLDFEGCATFPSADNFGAGITSELTVNPLKEGINTSDFVLKVDKPTGSDFFAGIQNTFASNFDLTTTDVFKVKVYSTKANVVFRFELLANPNDGSIGNPAPVFVTIADANEWTEVEIIFTGLPAGPMAYNQLVIKPDNDQSDSAITAGGTYYIDDLTLNGGDASNDPVPPTTPAPAPTELAADVISIYSDAYTDVVRDGLNFYGAAGFEEVQIDGNGSLKYTFVDGDGGNFQVIELGGSNQIDAATAGMTNFRFDAWFPNVLDDNSALLLKLVNFGTTTSEASINVNSSSTPAIAQGSWLSFDIPFTELESNGLTGSGNIQQLVVDLVTSGEVYLDNIYFYNGSGGSGSNDPVPPTTPAPAPTELAADVISIYSDAYTDVARDGLNFYGAAGFEEVQIDGNGSLKYTFVDGDGGNFQVIELGGSNQIDAATAGMTNFRFDAWFPNVLDDNSALLLKLVNFGTTTSEAAINVNSSSTPAIAQGSWLSFDIPFTELESNGLTGSGNIQQLVVDLVTSGEVYLDNIYFYKTSGSSGSGGCTSTAVAATGFPVNFEGCESFLSTFTDVGSISTELADNPAKTGINTSDFVLKVVKAAGSNRWAGFQNPFPSNFDATKTFKVKVYSTKANVVMKFEVNSDPQPPASGNPGPQYVTIVEANTWTEVEITFTGIPGNNTGLNQFVIKPDNPDGTDGTTTDSEGIYYFDDIRLE